MNRDNFEDLPQWMKELWELAPNLARQAEKHISKLESKVAAQQSVQLTWLTSATAEMICSPSILMAIVRGVNRHATNASRWASSLLNRRKLKNGFTNLHI